MVGVVGSSPIVPTKSNPCHAGLRGAIRKGRPFLFSRFLHSVRLLVSVQASPRDGFSLVKRLALCHGFGESVLFGAAKPGSPGSCEVCALVGCGAVAAGVGAGKLCEGCVSTGGADLRYQLRSIWSADIGHAAEPFCWPPFSRGRYLVIVMLVSSVGRLGWRSSRGGHLHWSARATGLLVLSCCHIFRESGEGLSTD